MWRILKALLDANILLRCRDRMEPEHAAVEFNTGDFARFTRITVVATK